MIKNKKYESPLSLIETEVAIKKIKDFFETSLARKLSLTRVSAPLFVTKSSGLNDSLSGIEKPVSFIAASIAEEIEIVQSLAKWKRNALKKYDFQLHQGLYTDMNAIRKDEQIDAIHSIYVDQWDWEKSITNSDLCLSYLKFIVTKIYEVIYTTKRHFNKAYPCLTQRVPQTITFIDSEELLQKYPGDSAKIREYKAAKEFGAIFITRIGWPLSNKLPHDQRAADYDDWNLNGDIIVYAENLDVAMELSSMGIRVDKTSLTKQLEAKNETDKLNNTYCQDIINSRLPLSIGGGIGQSRLSMFILEKIHISEVQASIWNEKETKYFKKNNINSL